MNHKGVCRTAPATTSMLKTLIFFKDAGRILEGLFVVLTKNQGLNHPVFVCLTMLSFLSSIMLTLLSCHTKQTACR